MVENGGVRMGKYGDNGLMVHDDRDVVARDFPLIIGVFCLWASKRRSSERKSKARMSRFPFKMSTIIIPLFPLLQFSSVFFSFFQ